MGEFTDSAVKEPCWKGHNHGSLTTHKCFMVGVLGTRKTLYSCITITTNYINTVIWMTAHYIKIKLIKMNKNVWMIFKLPYWDIGFKSGTNINISHNETFQYQFDIVSSHHPFVLASKQSIIIWHSGALVLFPHRIDFLALGRCGRTFKNIIFKFIIQDKSLGYRCETSLR